MIALHDLGWNDGPDFTENPLICPLCGKLLSEPCVLRCHHVFCFSCIHADARSDVPLELIICPTCKSSQNPTDLQKDSLLKFFIASANEEADVCANCDRATQPMYFCETCQQALCFDCKTKTHQARMFCTHKVVLLEERTASSASGKCPTHQEPFILFSMDHKNLKCINCFRSSQIDSRKHYVDLAAAFDVGCERLNHVAKQLKTFQKDLQDNIRLNRTLADEANSSAKSESTAIQILTAQICEAVTAIRDRLLGEIELERAEKVGHFEHNVSLLSSAVPTIQLYLLMASVFASSASQTDFLQHGFILIARIQSFINEYQEHRPKFVGTIRRLHKQELIKVVEPLLESESFTLGSSVLVAGENSLPSSKNKLSATRSSDSSPGSSVGSWQYLRVPRRFMQVMAKTAAVSSVETCAGDDTVTFSQHFQKLEDNLTILAKRFSCIRKKMDEVQRDMTLRRCVVSEKRAAKLTEACESLHTELSAHGIRVDELRPDFQRDWGHQLRVISQQQDTFQAHANQLCMLLEDSERVSVLAQKLPAFILTITQAIEVISPQRCEPEYCSPMQQICVQISHLEPDSQHRVDAIAREEENRKCAKHERHACADAALLGLRNKLKAAPKERRGKGATGADAAVVVEVARDRGSLPSPSKRREKPATLSIHSPLSEVSSSSSGANTDRRDDSLDVSFENEDLGSSMLVPSHKLERARTIAVGGNNRGGEPCSSPLSSSLPLPDALSPQMPDLLPKQAIAHVRPVVPLPTIVLPGGSQVTPGTIEARERVLASLRERAAVIGLPCCDKENVLP